MFALLSRWQIITGTKGLLHHEDFMYELIILPGLKINFSLTHTYTYMYAHRPHKHTSTWHEKNQGFYVKNIFYPLLEYNEKWEDTHFLSVSMSNSLSSDSQAGGRRRSPISNSTSSFCVANARMDPLSCGCKHSKQPWLTDRLSSIKSLSTSIFTHTNKNRNVHPDKPSYFWILL